MAFDKHKAPGKQVHATNHPDEKKEKKKKPFGEGSKSDQGGNLDSYDKEQKIDKELGEKKPVKSR
jgi:ribosome assembly protein YihI (activator of Der GTPase)